MDKLVFYSVTLKDLGWCLRPSGFQGAVASLEQASTQAQVAQARLNLESIKNMPQPSPEELGQWLRCMEKHGYDREKLSQETRDWKKDLF
ncbi:hypothetical protein NCS56_01546400 [Fusarium sp. Ph1]|nr:hypothetical protein NCS56_01546400 [Fusarium sp. Ph1]